MAMNLGNQYVLDKVSADDFRVFNEQIGVDARLVFQRLGVIAPGIERYLPTVAKELLAAAIQV
jgi:hypothetical protein